jgi:hypothetical protein
MLRERFPARKFSPESLEIGPESLEIGPESLR